jgi:secondary thiamine-phosphate synthase enzyme
MDTLTPVRACRFGRICLTTSHPTEFIDLTDRLNQFIAEADVCVGLLNVQTSHTTAAIVVNEHEPLLLADFKALLERTVPESAAYGHDDMSRRVDVPVGEPTNGHAHCRALLLPTSACLNVVDGRLALGSWQRVFLVELDGPRTREVSVVAVGESGL